MSYNEELESHMKRIDLAKAMSRLKEQDDFKLVFDEAFVKNWALTQTYNVAGYQQQSRIGVMENMIARSHFLQFCDEIIEDGKIAKEDLKTLLEEQEENKEDN